MYLLSVKPVYDIKNLPARVITRPLKTSVVYNQFDGDVDYDSYDEQCHIYDNRIQRQGGQLRGSPYW